MAPRVTIDFLKVLGLQPCWAARSRSRKTQPNGPRVAMIGEALWHERFGGRADVLGKELRLNSRVYTMVGVLPKAAEFPAACASGCRCRTTRPTGDGYSYDGLGRLKPGDHASNRPAPICCACSNRFSTQHDKERVVSPFTRDLRAQFTREFGTVASTLGAAVALLLDRGLRQRRRADARARARPPARDRHSPRRGRQPGAPAPATARRKHPALGRRRRARTRRRSLGDPAC